MLTREEIDEAFEYDNTIGQLRWKYHHITRKIGTIAGNVGNRGYRRVYYKGKFRNCHRMIWLLIYGYEPNIIDHIDHNKDNNFISNLRDVNTSINQQNQLYSKKQGSKIPGVYYDTRINRYRVRLYIGGKMINFGTFTEKDRAEEHGLEMRRLHYPGNIL